MGYKAQRTPEKKMYIYVYLWDLSCCISQKIKSKGDKGDPDMYMNLKIIIPNLPQSYAKLEFGQPKTVKAIVRVPPTNLASSSHY